MAFNTDFKIEGQNTSRPPYFDGSNYAYWKTRMRYFLMQNTELFECVSKEVTLPNQESISTWTEEQRHINELNAKAVNILHCALSAAEFNRIISCKTAKEIWDYLEVTHEGTKKVKNTKIAILASEYQNFTMNAAESIKEMFTRFNDIVTNLQALGKEISNEEKVQKVLGSLPPNWEPKVTAIEEARDISTLSMDDLLGTLLTHEIKMKKKENSELKMKSLALKVKEEEDSISSGNEDDDIALLTKRFNKFIKKRRFSKNKFRGENKKNFKDTNPEIKCFECKKPGHIKADCPLLKKPRKFRKKKALAAWSDEDSSSSESSQQDEAANLCFMAQSNEEVSSSSSNSESISINSLHDEYNLLLETYNKLVAKNKVMKGILSTKEKECNDLKSAYDDTEKKLKEKEKESEDHRTKLLELEKKNKDLEESFEKLLEGKKKLEMILGSQRHTGEKHGIGFVHGTSSTSAPKFVRGEVLHKPSFARNHIKYRNDHNFYRRNRLVCHYCNKHGHHIKFCYLRKNAGRLKLAWIPKDVNKDDIVVANNAGPKMIWVPKVT